MFPFISFVSIFLCLNEILAIPMIIFPWVPSMYTHVCLYCICVAYIFKEGTSICGVGQLMGGMNNGYHKAIIQILISIISCLTICHTKCLKVKNKGSDCAVYCVYLVIIMHFMFLYVHAQLSMSVVYHLYGLSEFRLL